ncbi:MAG: hypothetical protein C0618_00865 [Desulfuromonas sp.]|nr:MAG: hypothetical protein C0618_00865 [Desulfuromonas sp.]
MKKVLLALCAVVGIAGALFVFTVSGDQSDDVALAEFTVQNMTCSSCVGTIAGALDRLDGVRQVDISVTRGRCQVVFNPEQIEAQTIADEISRSGFPASIQLQLTRDEYRALQQEKSRLAGTYLARIGNRLIARETFDKQLALALVGAPTGAENQIRASLWQDIKNRALLLAAAEQNQIVISDAEVALRIEELARSTSNFSEAITSGVGDEESFRSRIKEDMIIRRNIEQNVIADVADPQQQRLRLNQWFEEISRTIPVELFDSDIEQSTAAAGCGSGGACCSG